MSSLIAFLCLLAVLQGTYVNGSPIGGACSTDIDCTDEGARCVNPLEGACYVSNFTNADVTTTVCPTLNTTRNLPNPACVAVPDPVLDVHVSQISRSENNSKLTFNVTWKPASKYFGPLVYAIDVNNYSPKDPFIFVRGSPILALQDKFYEVFEDLDGAWNYSIRVTAITAAGYSKPHAPVLVVNSKPYFPSNVRVMRPSDDVTSFPMRLCSSCLTDPNQGVVQAAAIVICDARRSRRCWGSYFSSDDNPPTQISKAEDLNLLPTWATVKGENFVRPYRATPDNFLETIKKESSEEFVYTIGGSDCDERDTQTFCNGPLTPDSSFRVAVILCNDIGCTVHSSTETYETDNDDEESRTIVIVVLAVLLGVAVLICIALAVFLIRMKRFAGQ